MGILVNGRLIVLQEITFEILEVDSISKGLERDRNLQEENRLQTYPKAICQKFN